MAERTPPDAREELSRSHGATSLTLLDKIRLNHPDVWPRLDHIYGGIIRYWCTRMGVLPANVDDVKQEVYTVVFQKREQFRRDRPGDTFRGWLRAIARNIIRAHLRKIQEQPCPEGGTDAVRRLRDVPDPVVDDEDDPEEQRAARVHRALELIQSELPARQRQVFELTLQGLNAREVADRLGISHGAVRVMKTRVLKRLREELGDDEWTDPADQSA